MKEPTWGTTKSGQPVHAKNRHYVKDATTFRYSKVKEAVKEVEGFNSKLAVLITSAVGTMACAYLFAALALISLPDAIDAGRPAIISWIAQTFLQLVLLAVIMVGQKVQSVASEIRANKQFEDIEKLLDMMDLDTEGGLADLQKVLEDKAARPIAVAVYPEVLFVNAYAPTAVHSTAFVL